MFNNFLHAAKLLFNKSTDKYQYRPKVYTIFCKLKLYKTI